MHTFHSLIRTIIITALLASSSGLKIKLKYFKAIHGTSVISTKAIFRTIKTSSQHVCYMSCGEDDSCQGYNYVPKEGRCELLDSQCLPGEEISSPGNIYMERLDRRYCKNQSTCYMYGIASWDGAFDVCRLLHPDAKMIEERSAEEAEKNIAEAVLAGQTRYWLAGRRPAGGGRYEFYWVASGESVVYTRWRESQPYEASPEDDCISARGEFQWFWDDRPCLDSDMYMCKKQKQ